MKRTSALIAMAATALLAGCAQQTVAPMAQKPTVTYASAAQNDFLQSGRAAIDALTNGWSPQTLASGPLLVATLVNVNDLTRSAPLGRTLSEHYATHLSNQGHHVKEVKLRGDMFVREGTGELLLSRELRDIARSQNAAVVLVGTYSPASDYTYVNLKLVRTEDSRILRGYDYALPHDRDVQRLLQEPKFR